MKQNHSEETLTHPKALVHLAALDSLDLPFLYLDADCRSSFLSSRAAKLLHVRHRHELEKYSELLSPLVEFAKRSAPSFRSHNLSPGPSHVASEITLQSAELSPKTLLVEVQRLNIPLCGNAECSAKLSGYILMLHELAPLEPFFESVEQSRRMIPVLILAASAIGGPFPLEARKNTLLADPLQLYYTINNKRSLDLLEGIATAVEIADQILPRSVKIVQEIKTSFLLNVPRPEFLRFMLHLLVDAAEFTGPFGLIKLKQPPISPNGRGHEQPATAGTTEVTLLSQRRTHSPQDNNAFARYVRQRSIPGKYKISTEEDESSHPVLSSEKPIVRRLISPDSSVQSPRINQSIARESLSEHLGIACKIAQEYSIGLHIRKLRTDVLGESIRLPLSTAAISTGHKK